MNPCSINPRVAAISVEYAIEAIRMAERIGAALVTVHPGRRTAKREPSAPDYTRFEAYVAGLREAAEETGVKVAIENMEPRINTLLATAEDTAEVLEREPWLWFTLDMGHAMMNSPAEVGRFLDLCIERMANVHVSALGGNGRPHHPIHDDPQLSGCLRNLADRGYEVTSPWNSRIWSFRLPLLRREDCALDAGIGCVRYDILLKRWFYNLCPQHNSYILNN